jgi:hypothetical protein
MTPFQIYALNDKDIIAEKLTIYKLDFMNKTYSIPFSVNAEILAMRIDPESRSLLIGLTNTQNSIFTIELKHELISAQNNDFVVLANGREIDYKITTNSNSSKFAFAVPEFTEEVEIIGTNVIPEFPGLTIMIVGIMIFNIIIFAKVKFLFFR